MLTLYGECTDFVADSDSKCSVPRKPGYKKVEIGRVRDDGDSEVYEARLEEYYKRITDEASSEDYVELCGGLKVPTGMWSALYGYGNMSRFSKNCFVI